jgi:hypothetical protein
MAKLFMIVSSARTIRLADGSDHPTGYRAEEVTVRVSPAPACWWPKGPIAHRNGRMVARRHSDRPTL